MRGRVLGELAAEVLEVVFWLDGGAAHADDAVEVAFFCVFVDETAAVDWGHFAVERGDFAEDALVGYAAVFGEAGWGHVRWLEWGGVGERGERGHVQKGK